MNKRIRVFLFGSIFVLTLIATMTLLPNTTKADTFNDFIFFRIDTELDTPNTNGAAATGVTIRWKCNGSGEGSVQDGTASESGGAVNADGIIKIASLSAENIAGEAGCDAGESITATASLNGWVSRVWSGTVAAGGSNVTFTTRASQDYLFVVNGAKDELDNTFTMTGTSTSTTITASASYSGTYASSSYSGGKWYVAPTGNGDIAAGKDGYVKKTKAVAWLGDYKTASKSADFDGVAANSDYNGAVLQFGVRVNLDKADRTGKTYSNVAGATVTAGTALAVVCTDNSDGDYYCAVPLAHTGVLASADSIPVGGQSENITCTYTDRTAGGDAQSTCTITANEPSSGGGNSGGGGGGGAYVAVATPTPTPSLSPTPTPVPGLSPTPTPASAGVTGVVKLFRKANDPKVYVQKDDGTLSWVKTLTDFNAAGYKWTDVKVISGSEFGKMRVGGDLRVVKGIGFLRVRSGSSTANKIVGKVLPNQELKFIEIKNGWYHIDSGWVSGAYVKEF